MITVEQLRSEISYDPETGQFHWLTSGRGRRVNGLAGTVNNHGQVLIMINYQRYLANRLAWFYVYGEWPKGEVDHINRNRQDNRLCNLRDISHMENMANTARRSDNTSGERGVCFDHQKWKWKVQLTFKGGKRYAKHFETKDEAVSHARAKRAEMFGEFNAQE